MPVTKRSKPLTRGQSFFISPVCFDFFCCIWCTVYFSAAAGKWVLSCWCIQRYGTVVMLKYWRSVWLSRVGRACHPKKDSLFFVCPCSTETWKQQHHPNNLPVTESPIKTQIWFFLSVCNLSLSSSGFHGCIVFKHAKVATKMFGWRNSHYRMLIETWLYLFL